MGSSVGASSAYPSSTEVLVIESPASDPLSDILFVAMPQKKNSSLQYSVINSSANGMMVG